MNFNRGFDRANDVLGNLMTNLKGHSAASIKEAIAIGKGLNDLAPSTTLKDGLSMAQSAAGALNSGAGALQTLTGTLFGKKVLDKGIVNAIKNRNAKPSKLQSIVDGVKTYALPVAALGAGVTLLSDAASPAKQAMVELGTYHGMIKKFGLPDDAETRDYFNVVKTYSPMAARNPIVAGTMVSRMREFNGIDPNMVTALGNIKDNSKPAMSSTLVNSAIRDIVGFSSGAYNG